MQSSWVTVLIKISAWTMEKLYSSKHRKELGKVLNCVSIIGLRVNICFFRVPELLNGLNEFLNEILKRKKKFNWFVWHEPWPIKEWLFGKTQHSFGQVSLGMFVEKTKHHQRHNSIAKGYLNLPRKNTCTDKLLRTMIGDSQCSNSWFIKSLEARL